MNDYKVTLNGTTLMIVLGKVLNTANAPALQEELAKYMDEVGYEHAGGENILSVMKIIKTK